MTALERKLVEVLKGIAGYAEKVKPENIPGGAPAMLALINVMAAEAAREAEGAT